MDNWQSLAVFSGAVVLAACSGAVFKPGVWYESLDKPSWTPPNWVFPVGWTLLYIMIAYAGWRAWISENASGWGIAFAVYALQLVLNGAWSGIFFGLRRMGLALIDCLALLGCIAANIILFVQIDMLSGLLLAPYFLWVTFAAALNASVLGRNPLYR